MDNRQPEGDASIDDLPTAAPAPQHTSWPWLTDRSLWRDVAAIGLLALAVSVFHWRGLMPGTVFLAVDIAHNQLPWILEGERPIHNWLLSDPVWQFYPFIAHAIGPDGNSLWNPDIFLGHPRFADPLAQPYYPAFRIMGRLFGAARGLTLSLWLHVLWAAGCMYGFLRTTGLSRRSAVFGSMTYVLSGYLVTWFEYTHLTSTLAWLPAVLWTYELAVKRRAWRYAALSAICLGIAILNGQFQFVGVFLFLLGLYALAHGLGFFDNDHGQRSFLPAAQFVFVAAGGMVMAAVLVLPFASYLGATNRAGVAGLRGALPSWQLLTLLVPDFFGNPTITIHYRGAGNYNEATIYAGVVALLLACAAPFQTRRRGTAALAGITLLAVYFVIGGPGVRAIGQLPFMGYLSLARSTFVLPILLGMLAAHWMNARCTTVTPVAVAAVLAAAVVIGVVLFDFRQVLENLSILRSAIITSLALMLAVVILVALRKQWPDHARYVDWALVVLLFVDLALWGARYNSAGKVAELYPQTPGIGQLQEIAPVGRVAALQTARDALFGLNVAPLFGFSEPGGYSSLVPARLKELIAAGDPKDDALGVADSLKRNFNIAFFYEPSMRLMDLLSVTHVLSPVALPLGDAGMEYEAISCETASAEITGSTVVSTTFPVHHTAINRLDLQFRRQADLEPAGELLLRMWREDEERTLMFEERLDPSQVADREVVTFYFAPEPTAPGHRYDLAVSAVDGADTHMRLCAAADGTPSLAVGGADWHELSTDEFYTYERAAPMPRAYVAYRAEPIAGGAETVSRLLDERFDLRNVAVVEPQSAPGLRLEQLVDTILPATAAEVLEDLPDRITIRAHAQRYGVLVLSERYHAGWRARVDGEPATVFPVNYVYRGVALEPGEHEIIFEFRPLSLRIGAALSLGALFLCLVIIIVGYRRRQIGDDGET